MTAAVQPATLAGASVVIQVCLLFIAYVALHLLAKSYTARAQAKASYSTLVGWLLLTLVLLMVGEDQYAIWGPILGAIVLPTVPRDYSFLVVFVLDIIFVSVLIIRTGGSKRSPFTSRFLFYSILVGTTYVLILRRSMKVTDADFDRSEYAAPSRADEQVDDRATIWTNVSCLVLATLIGYITSR
jgi:hypothetical protein